MDLKELYQAYKVKKLAFEAAKKEEEKYKKLVRKITRMRMDTALSVTPQIAKALMRRGSLLSSMRESSMIVSALRR